MAAKIDNDMYIKMMPFFEGSPFLLVINKIQAFRLSYKRNANYFISLHFFKTTLDAMIHFQFSDTR